MRAQCSHASVGLAQARPNDVTYNKLDECRALWGEPEQAVCQVKSGLLLTSIDSEHTATLVMCTGSYTIRKAVEKSQLFNYYSYLGPIW